MAVPIRKTFTYRGINFSRWRYYTGLRGDRSLDWSPSVKQIENLIDLADVLRIAPPPVFSMGTYASISKEAYAKLSPTSLDRVNESGLHATHNLAPLLEAKAIEERLRADAKEKGDQAFEEHFCGTSCCASGTAVFHSVGFELLKGEMPDTFGEYNTIVFGVRERTETWAYLFDDEWADIDDTAVGAAARILYFVMNGPMKAFGEVRTNVDGHPVWHGYNDDMREAMKAYDVCLDHPIAAK